ncbi:MAG: response regulator transcription factor [Dehalococcoidia bacterium]|nr:response regulator transcription factor [Dehalococcoidia bacterium]
MNDGKVEIVLADDHKVVRQGIGLLLGLEPGFEVIGEARDGTEAVTLAEELKPDILITDLAMNGMNGIEVTRRVRASSPQTGIIILSMYDNVSYVFEALNAGAGAYVLKGSGIDELVQAVRAVTAGRRYLSSTLSEEKTEEYGKRTGRLSPDP